MSACYEGLGCLNLTDFYDPKLRFVNAKPWPRAQIGTRFLIYTPTTQYAPDIFSWNVTAEQLRRSSFDPSIETKVFTHGFMQIKKVPDFPMRRHHTKAPSLNAGSPSSTNQSEQTHESGVVGSTASSPASCQIAPLLKKTTSSTAAAPSAEGSPKPCHLPPPPPQDSDRSNTKRRGSRPVAKSVEDQVAVQRPPSQQQAELKTESRESPGSKPSSEQLASTDSNAQPEAQPGEAKLVDAQAQTQEGVKTAVQEETQLETKPETKLEPTLETEGGVKPDATHDQTQANQEQQESLASQAVQVQTDGPPLKGAVTSDMATQHTPAAATAPPVVRHAAMVDTGTDTPNDLLAPAGPVPELPFASAEYTSPAGPVSAQTAAASGKQPAEKKRFESTAKGKTSLGRKSGPATTELGGVASTEATVMLDVNPYVRFPLLVMNLIIWLIGLTLLLVGAYAYVDTWAQSEIPMNNPSYNVLSMFVIKMEITVMLFGMITMSLSFCGCVGALRENTCLLNVYSSFITALLLINLVVGLVVFFLPSQIKKMLSETFSMELIVHYRDSPDFQRLMDSMQVVSLSCGRNVLNMTDYDAWFQVYTGNCLDSAHRYVRENVTIITGLCLVFVILLAFVQMVTQALIDEILIIRRIYEKFYERAYDMRAAQEQTEPSAN
ncbi:hypothetical protein V5799_028689 [Amblyomma americanum]|uniref:Tetraspanin n=1 Tax=Amblyomma americanum TaxID=6943 RepID=A0AAQ4DC59_AMBAM